MTIKLSIDTKGIETVELNSSGVHYRIAKRHDYFISRRTDGSHAVCVATVTGKDYFHYDFISDDCFAHESDAKDAVTVINTAGVDYFVEGYQRPIARF